MQMTGFPNVTWAIAWTFVLPALINEVLESKGYREVSIQLYKPLGHSTRCTADDY